MQSCMHGTAFYSAPGHVGDDMLKGMLGSHPCACTCSCLRGCVFCFLVCRPMWHVQARLLTLTRSGCKRHEGLLLSFRGSEGYILQGCVLKGVPKALIRAFSPTQEDCQARVLQKFEFLCSLCLRGGLGKSALGFVLVCQLGVEDFASSAAGPAAAPGLRHRGHLATFLAKVGRPVVS